MLWRKKVFGSILGGGRCLYSHENHLPAGSTPDYKCVCAEGTYYDMVTESCVSKDECSCSLPLMLLDRSVSALELAAFTGSKAAWNVIQLFAADEIDMDDCALTPELGIPCHLFVKLQKFTLKNCTHNIQFLK